MKFTKETVKNHIGLNFGQKQEKIEKNVTEQMFEIEVLQPSIPASSNFSKSEKKYLFDAELGNNGLSFTGLWHITSRRYYSDNHSFWYGNEVSGNYDTGNANSGELEFPQISLENMSKPVLYFKTWYQTRSNKSVDKKLVQLSVDNSLWIDLNQISNVQEKWNEETINLSQYIGKRIRIRFIFNTVDNGYNKYEGWYIDDIYIIGG